MKARTDDSAVSLTRQLFEKLMRIISQKGLNQNSSNQEEFFPRTVKKIKKFMTSGLTLKTTMF